MSYLVFSSCVYDLNTILFIMMVHCVSRHTVQLCAREVKRQLVGDNSLFLLQVPVLKQKKSVLSIIFFKIFSFTFNLIPS